MEENNNTYKMHNGLRVHTDVLKDKYLNVNLNQDIEQLEILSLKIDTDNFYKLHTSSYGCLVGRVLANQGVGIPNVKLSVFIPVESADLENPVFKYLYPYTSVKSKDSNGIRYNLLPDSVDDKCHQDVGTFPNKRLVLDDANVIEVFDKYFKYTTVTNASGDYMLFGLPVGNQIIHSELDLSDIGILSQKPRDLFYKGYNHTQFENSSQFKTSKSLDSLTQIFSQDNSVQVYPFWGDDEAENIDGVDSQVKITRHDVDINYKFEPTCIFIGSLVADDKANGFSKRCIPSERSGKMDRLTTGAGTIEMIRKTPDGYVESVNIQGNSLIDGNGTWCYQIPMNLDYVKTDEYGNLVPAENEMTGIPTRTRVRFRISLADYESDSANAHLPKVLVPNNPSLEELQKKVDNGKGSLIPQGPDYNFGTYTRDESYRDLFWNNVYTVKQYIPRIQNIIADGPHVDRNKNFSGFKAVNVNGSNNPIPYNNIRVQLTFLFIFQCIIFKALVLIVKIINNVIFVIKSFANDSTNDMAYVLLDGGMCPNMEGYYMAFGAHKTAGLKAEDRKKPANQLIWNTLILTGDGISMKDKDGGQQNVDTKGVDNKSSENKNGENIAKTVVAEGDYFVKCVELQFAMEYEVIQFDFYNDWINGLIYLPRWFAEIKRRKRVDKVVACNENHVGNRQLVQQCALNYDSNGLLNYNNGCSQNNKCHKSGGRKHVAALYQNWAGGIIQTYKNHIDDKYLYYLRPSEEKTKHLWSSEEKKQIDSEEKVKLNLFATDIVMLGSVLECNTYGYPLATGYPSSTFTMPPPTGEVLSDSQEMGLGKKDDDNYATLIPIGHDKYVQINFFSVNKKSPNTGVGEGLEVEMSGIDWGYNPFTLDNNDDTTTIDKQQGGHFLEIGCTFSQTSPKSCINLQRICELGAEMSQSHYYRNGSTTGGTFFSTTGIISAREVIGEDLRTKFASLNSNKLKTVTDINTGYKMYDLLGYTPYNFNGALRNFNDKGKMDWNALGENKSDSYNFFRFMSDKDEAGANKDLIFANKFLYAEVRKNNDEKYVPVYYSMPVYENSFYFYFGLKDGNTAIDRLYVEYFSECGHNEAEEGETITTNNEEEQK